MNARVLIVDDQSGFVAALALNLRARGYEVLEASTVAEAMTMFRDVPPDIVLLDLGLPDGSGLDVIARIRATSWVPILVVSARSDDRDMVAVLDAGADGYVTKPFGLEELLARVRVALRRQRGGATPVVREQVVTDHFEIDLVGRTVRTAEGAVRLTPTEWGLVDHLVGSAGRLVPHRELLSVVWGPESIGHGNYIRVHLAHLRKKLEPDPARPVYFVTEPGLGVRFDESPVESVPREAAPPESKDPSPPSTFVLE